MHSLRQTIGKLKQRLFLMLPSDSHNLYRYCRYYVDRYQGENNGDFRTNGEFRLIQEVLPSARVLFDVGANSGEWASLALSINPNLTIHAFEPTRFAFEKLRTAVDSRAICNHFGLSSKEGAAEVHIVAPGHGFNSIYVRDSVYDEHGQRIEQAAVEKIELRTLDAYCIDEKVDYIDYLKIDVEGHDFEVIRGSERMLRERRIGWVQFEYSNCNIDSRVMLKDFFRIFGSLPYDLFKVLPHGLRAVSRYESCLENFQYQNWVARLRGGSAAENAHSGASS